MTDRELEQEIARLKADAGRGRVVVYLPTKAPVTYGAWAVSDAYGR